MNKNEVDTLKLLKSRYNKETLKDFLALIKKGNIEVEFKDNQIEVKYYSEKREGKYGLPTYDYAYSMFINNKTNRRKGKMILENPKKSHYRKVLKLLEKCFKLFNNVTSLYVYKNNVELWKNKHKLDVRIEKPIKLKVSRLVRK